MNGKGFVKVGPLGLGGNLRWNSGIGMIRPEPRRKARMEMRSSKVSESCGGIELIRMIRMEPRRKPRME